MSFQTTRPSPIAGQWYPDDPLELAAVVDGFLQAAGPAEIEGDILGVTAPHAGYRFSGGVAGHAFAQIRGLKPELVIIVSPMHGPHPHPLLTSAHRGYKTPLGLVPINPDARQELDTRLSSDYSLGLFPLVKDREHAIEIELPFLQRALHEPFELLPVMIRDQSLGTIQALSKALAAILAPSCAVLLVASGDLSHFRRQEQARRIDRGFLRRVASFDPDGILSFGLEAGDTICGTGAVACVLLTARALGANRVKVLSYATSGDITGDYSSVVGYAASVIYRE